MLRSAAICLIAGLGLSAGALAQDDTAASPASPSGNILLHLYQVQAIAADQTGGQNNACRIYFMLQNEMADQLSVLDLDAYLFDTSDAMQEHVRLGFSAVPAQKRRMFPFDIANIDCQSVGTVMINDILTCTTSATGPGKDCAANLVVDSRAPDVAIEDSAPRPSPGAAMVTQGG